MHPASWNDVGYAFPVSQPGCGLENPFDMEIGPTGQSTFPDVLTDIESFLTITRS